MKHPNNHFGNFPTSVLYWSLKVSEKPRSNGVEKLSNLKLAYLHAEKKKVHSVSNCKGEPMSGPDAVKGHSLHLQRCLRCVTLVLSWLV